MTEAKKFVEEMANLDNYTDTEKYMEDNKWNYEFDSHGFIFKDGSILDISLGEDHRIIPEKEWNKKQIMTYNFMENKLTIRFNGLITPQQRNKLREIIEDYDINNIFYDIYNMKDKLVKSGNAIGYYDLIQNYNGIDLNENKFFGNILKLLNEELKNV